MSAEDSSTPPTTDELYKLSEEDKKLGLQALEPLSSYKVIVRFKGVPITVFLGNKDWQRDFTTKANICGIEKEAQTAALKKLLLIEAEKLSEKRSPLTATNDDSADAADDVTKVASNIIDDEIDSNITLAESKDSESKKLIKLIDSMNLDLFLDQYSQTYIVIPTINNIREPVTLKDSKFTNFAFGIYYDRYGEVINQYNIDGVARLLSYKANKNVDPNTKEPITKSLYVRAAWENTATHDTVLLDLVDNERHIIKMEKSKPFKVITQSNVDIKFRRYQRGPLPVPLTDYKDDVKEGNVFDEYLDLFKVPPENKLKPEARAKRILLKCQMGMRMIPGIPHPIEAATGSKGAIKSSWIEHEKLMIDPSEPLSQGIPDTLDDFSLVAYHNYVIVFDNLKQKDVPKYFPAAACRYVYGLGREKRELYSNMGVVGFSASGCMITAGILKSIEDEDYIDRCISTYWKRLKEGQFLPLEEVEKQFLAIRPKLLGYMCNKVGEALALYDSVKVEIAKQTTRMADFMIWGECFARAYGYQPQEFIQAYRGNLNEQHIETVRDMLLGKVLVNYIHTLYREKTKDRRAYGRVVDNVEIAERADKQRDKKQVLVVFEDSFDKLCKDLDIAAKAPPFSVDIESSREWPKTPNKKSEVIRLLQSNLDEGFGIDIEMAQDTNKKHTGYKNRIFVKITYNPNVGPTDDFDVDDNDGKGKGDGGGQGSSSSSSSGRGARRRKQQQQQQEEQQQQQQKGGKTSSRTTPTATTVAPTKTAPTTTKGAQTSDDGANIVSDIQSLLSLPSLPRTEESSSSGKDSKDGKDTIVETISRESVANTSSESAATTTVSLLDMHQAARTVLETQPYGFDKPSPLPALMLEFSKCAAFDPEWYPDTDEWYEAAFTDTNRQRTVLHIADFGSEKALIKAIVAKLNEYQIIVGWWSRGKLQPGKHYSSNKLHKKRGDLIRLHEKCLQYGIESPINTNSTYDPWPTLNNGAVMIDLHTIFDMQLVKDTIFHRAYQSTKLDEVYTALCPDDPLGGKLEDIEGPDATTLPAYIQRAYVQRDADITLRLAEIRNGQLLGAFLEIAKYIDLPFEEVCHSTLSKWWKRIFDNMGFEGSEIDPTTGEPYYFESEKTNESALGGGLNLHVKKGLYNIVRVLDVASLYPFMVMLYNLSFDCICCPCCKEVPEAQVPKEVLVDADGNPLSRQNYWICQRGDGAFTTKLKEIWNQRADYKRKMKQAEASGDFELARIYEVIQLALKILMNGGAGLFNNKFYHYRDSRVNELITSFGRYTLRQLEAIATSQKFGFEIIGGDTDSLYLINKGPDNLIEQFIKECAQRFKSRNFENDKLQLIVEDDRTYSKILFAADKNYVGLNAKTNKVDIKGMAGNKRSMPLWGREIFKGVVQDFFGDATHIADPRPKIIQLIEDLDSGKVPLNKLRKYEHLNKDPSEYKNANDVKRVLGLKYDLEEDDRVEYFFADKKKLKAANKKALSWTEDPTEIDYTTYKEYLRTAIEPFLKALGDDDKAINDLLKIEQVIKIPKQKGADNRSKNKKKEEML